LSDFDETLYMALTSMNITMCKFHSRDLILKLGITYCLTYIFAHVS